MSEAETGYVYTLNDPRTSEPRYVGASKQPEKRLTTHIAQPTSNDMEEWIEELEEQGLEPELTIVKETSVDELSSAEVDLMSSLRDECDLLNKDFNRGYVHQATVENVDDERRRLLDKREEAVSDLRNHYDRVNDLIRELKSEIEDVEQLYIDLNNVLDDYEEIRDKAIEDLKGTKYDPRKSPIDEDDIDLEEVDA